MKIIFASDVLCHHQLALCDEIYKLNPDFKFVECQKTNDERVKNQMEDFQRPYRIKFTNTKAIIENLKKAEIVIAGSVSTRLLLKCRKGTKIFKYSERLFKKPYSSFSIKEKIQRNLQNFLYKKIQDKSKLYLLSASAYAPYDFLQQHIISKENMFRWGYFPRTNDKKIIKAKKDDFLEITWFNRMIDWKHPEFPVELATTIKKKNYHCHITMIGTGYLFSNIKHQIDQKGLNSIVTLTGQIAPQNVIEYLKKSDIAIFSSDRAEGWGAGVNEAMAAGCVVVASSEMGSVPYLIKNNYNGFCYAHTKIDEFLKTTENIICNFEDFHFISKNAQNTIDTLWNPKEAARRLMNLIHDGIIENDTGPCSKAPIICD